MYGKIADHLQTRSDLLCSGQIEELVDLYHLPFVTYHDGVPAFIENRTKAIKVLSKIASLLASRDVVRLEVEVTSVELPKNKRFRVWSRYSQLNSCGDVISQSEVLQYFVETPTGPLVEMMESGNCPLAAIWEPEAQLAK